MSRSLTEIAAREQELRKALRDLRLSMNNKRASLDKDEADEGKILDELNTLAHEAAEAFERARAIGQGDLVEAPPPISDSRVTEAFNEATTPQDQTGIFNGQAF